MSLFQPIKDNVSITSPGLSLRRFKMPSYA